MSVLGQGTGSTACARSRAARRMGKVLPLSTRKRQHSAGLNSAWSKSKGWDVHQPSVAVGVHVHACAHSLGKLLYRRTFASSTLVHLQMLATRA